MVHNIEIDTRYLQAKDKKRFLRIENKIRNCYNTAITSFLEASKRLFSCEPPWLPKIYVVPFVYRLVEKNKYKICVNQFAKDPSEDRWAIFPSLPFLEKAPDKYVIASFAHELAHWLQSLKASKKQKEKLGLLDAAVKHEEGVEHFFQYFSEPVKTFLSEWNIKIDEFMDDRIGEMNYRNFYSDEELNAFFAVENK